MNRPAARNQGETLESEVPVRPPSCANGWVAMSGLAGMTAAVVDQSELLGGRLPLFIGGVVALSFLLLLAAFRSPRGIR